MQKTHKIYFYRYFHYVHIFLLYSTVHQSVAFAGDSYEYTCNTENSHQTNYKEFGEFSSIVEFVENEVAAQEEAEDLIQKGLLSKWTKNLKKWFTKRVKNIFKKCLNLNKNATVDDVAYAAAKFKRKIDRVYNTGKITDLFVSFDKNIPQDKQVYFEHLKNRIEFYHNHKHKKPPKHNIKKYAFLVKSDEKNQLEDIPLEAVVGGLEIFCGTLISVLPLPGCLWLGGIIAGDGLNRVFNSLLDDYRKTHPKKAVEETQGSYRS